MMDTIDLINKSIDYLNLDIVPRDFQMKVISHYCDGKDTFCIAGCGYGKSLTYTLCPIIMDMKKGFMPHTGNDGEKILHHIVIVVQPLVSLMKNQRDKLLHLGLRAVYVGDKV